MHNIYLAVQPAQALIFQGYLEDNNNDVSKALANWEQDLRIVADEMAQLSRKFSGIKVEALTDVEIDGIGISGVPEMIFESVKDLNIVDTETCADCGCDITEDNCCDIEEDSDAGDDNEKQGDL